MKKRTLFLFAAVLAASSGATTARSARVVDPLGIAHEPVGCVVAERFPRFEARIAPAESVAIVRVLFQGMNTEWYSVPMKPDGSGGAFSGVLPQPKKSLKAFRYYIEATDKAAGTSRTADYTTSVGEDPGACKGKITAAALAAASVLLQAPAGAVAIPAGFATAGVAVAGAAGSASVATAAAGAGGGGLSTGATVGIIGGAGVAAAVAVAGGGGDTQTATATPTPTPATICRLTLTTSPDQPTTGGGRFCTITARPLSGAVIATVSGQQVLTVPCATNIELSAATAGIYAEWGGACRGSALGVPCIFSVFAGADRTVSLTCSAT